jgi:hypothetical protein
MATPFMTDAEFDALEPIMADGWATLREWYGNTTITVARQGGTTVGTFPVVSVRLANREPATTGAGSPVGATELDGTLRLWTDDVTASPIHRGDRFLWNGQAVVIATPPMFKRGGVAEYGFTLQARNT